MRTSSSILVAAVLVAGLALGQPAWAAGGDLDPTFGDDGITISDDSGDGTEAAHDVVVLPDGSIFAVGNIAYETAGPFATYERYSSTGERLTVGDPGSVFANFDATSFRAAAVTPEGKVVAVGWAGQLTENGGLIRSRFLVARFLANGSLDPSFSGDGIVVTPMGWGDADANDVGVRGDGRIVVVGDALRRTGVIAVARYLPGGALDPTFGSNGRAFVSAPAGLWEARSVALDAYGRIIVAARRGLEWSAGGSPRFAVARLHPRGVIDDTFGTAGIATVDFGGRPAAPTEVVVGPDLRIVVGGTAVTPNGDRFALARLLPRGALDPTFDGDGRVLTRFVGGGGSLDGLLRQPDGRIVAGGWDLPGVFALARYRPNGTLDPTFGTNGMVRLTEPVDGRIEALARQADGKIVAAGSAAGSEAIHWTPTYARLLP
jgi:uncharacterized delta-60 repeat protein